jgi:tetratricopeptide (TPR) repeat protein
MGSPADGRRLLDSLIDVARNSEFEYHTIMWRQTLASGLESGGHYEDALSFIDPVLSYLEIDTMRGNSEGDFLWYGLATRAAIGAKMWDRARTYIAKSIANVAANSGYGEEFVVRDLAAFYFELAKYDSAIAYCDSLVNLMLSRPQLYAAEHLLYCGNILLLSSAKSKAESVFVKALKSYETDNHPGWFGDALSTVASSYLHSGDTATALKYFTEASSQYAKNHWYQSVEDVDSITGAVGSNWSGSGQPSEQKP